MTEVTVIVMSSDARDKYRGTKVYLVQYFKPRRKEDSYKLRKLKILKEALKVFDKFTRSITIMF